VLLLGRVEFLCNRRHHVVRRRYGCRVPNYSGMSAQFARVSWVMKRTCSWTSSLLRGPLRRALEPGLQHYPQVPVARRQ
jgi:hypothetical protein